MKQVDWCAIAREPARLVKEIEILKSRHFRCPIRVYAWGICLKALETRLAMVATKKSDEKVDTCSWCLKKLFPDCRTALDEFLLEFGAPKRFCTIYNSKEAGTEEIGSIGGE